MVIRIRLFLLLFSLSSQGQVLTGKLVNTDRDPIEGASIRWGELSTISDQTGAWSFDERSEAQVLQIDHIAFQAKEIDLREEGSFIEISLEPARLGLSEVVVSGGRKAVPRYDAPLIINTISPKLFENIAALSLAEGLSFSPGLRLENNCQNCGFTQVRMNGLEGAYSQILLNSRPIFSALMGVYGLEMFPPTMIDRVEVLKGGGSAIYGGNAIAGTINIITKEPTQNQFYGETQLNSIGGESWQNSQSVGASLINTEGNAGVNLFAFRRQRDAWDANEDGFTEITALENYSTGFNAFYKPSQRSKWTWDLFFINEFRRGGSDLDLKPHQSRIAEQLQHDIIGSGLSYERLSRDNKHQWSAYLSAQRTWRDSYYGGGGRIIPPGDSLSADDLIALNAYGQSRDLSIVGGALHHWSLSPRLNLSWGSELQFNEVLDQMSGYQRLIDQSTQNWGSYFQLEYLIRDDLSLQAGSRFDYNRISGSYALAGNNYYDEQSFWAPSPRFSLKYDLLPNLSLRSSYARGYRAPQAFNEDLHIAVVGGEALFIQLADDLTMETSNSLNFSAEWNTNATNWAQNLVINTFFTQLENNFILSDQQELNNGSARLIKRNGAGARVYGLNLEYNLSYGAWTLQSSITAQRSLFREPEILWDNAAEDSVVSSNRILRAPNLYGYFSIDYQLNDHLSLKSSANYTGPMLVQHIIDPNTEYSELVDSPHFLDFNLSAESKVWHTKDWELRLHGGIRNLFNAYQSDFDRGPQRDAGYIYGPLMPRNYFLALKLNAN